MAIPDKTEGAQLLPAVFGAAKGRINPEPAPAAQGRQQLTMLAPLSPQPWCETSTERPHRASLCPLTHAGVTAAATPNPSRAPGDVPTAPALALPPPWGHLLPQALPLEPSRGCWAHTWGGDTSPHPCPWQEDAGDASASAAGGCLGAFPWQCRCLRARSSGTQGTRQSQGFVDG